MKRLFLLMVAATALGTVSVEAGGPCCNTCGHGQAKYVCRLVCKMKDELTYEYDMDCDPYCMLGRSENCGKKRVCDDSLFGFHCETIWKPHCECKVRTKHTLVKVPVVKQVPVYTCVVERLCCGCGRNCYDMAATQRLLNAGVMPVTVERPLVELDEALQPLPPSAETTFAAPAPIQPVVAEVEQTTALPRLFQD